MVVDQTLAQLRCELRSHHSTCKPSDGAECMVISERRYGPLTDGNYITLCDSCTRDARSGLDQEHGFRDVLFTFAADPHTGCRMQDANVMLALHPGADCCVTAGSSTVG